jgi:hypothetical protein
VWAGAAIITSASRSTGPRAHPPAASCEANLRGRAASPRTCRPSPGSASAGRAPRHGGGRLRLSHAGAHRQGQHQVGAARSAARDAERSLTTTSTRRRGQRRVGSSAASEHNHGSATCARRCAGRQRVVEPALPRSTAVPRVDVSVVATPLAPPPPRPTTAPTCRRAARGRPARAAPHGTAAPRRRTTGSAGGAHRCGARPARCARGRAAPR